MQALRDPTLDLPRKERRSAVRDRAGTDFPLQRYTALIAGTLQVNQCEYESVTRTERRATMTEMEVDEINDLLMVTQAISTVKANCEEQKNTAIPMDWMQCTLITGSMSDSLYGLHHCIPSLQSPCNCFSLSALHAKRPGNLGAMLMAEKLFANCKHPDCSYTDCYTKVSRETVKTMAGIALHRVLSMPTVHGSRDLVYLDYSIETVCEPAGELVV